MSRYIMPRQGVNGQNLTPEDGAKLHFKVIGQGVGGTNKAVFTNEALTIAATNPVISDAKGLFGELWLNGDYDVFLTDKKDSPKWGPETIRNIAELSADAITTNELTTATMKANTIRSYAPGDIVKTKEFATGTGGGGTYDVVLTSSVTPTGGRIIVGVTDPLISFVLRTGGRIFAAQFGVDLNTGTAIISTQLQEAVDFANTIGVLLDSSAGAEVILDPGQGLINVPIILYGGFDNQERVSLIGAGSSSTTIKLADASNVDMIKWNSSAGFNHCRVEGILLDGNRANQTQPTATITAITAAATAVITATNTYTDGDLVAITGVSGMVEINGKHGVVANATGSQFDLKGVNSTSYTAYTSGGISTQKYRGIYAQNAFSGSRLTDLKINDIAGVAIDCEQVSNGPLIENVGITRAGTHGLYIHNSNNDGFSVTNMEVGTAGEDGIGFPYHVYNVSPAGHANFIFNNIRHDNGGAAQTPQAIESVVFEEAEVSCLFLSPRFRWNSDVSATFTAFKLNRNANTFLMIHGYGLDSAPIAVTEQLINDVDNALIHIATTSDPFIHYNAPMQFVNPLTSDLATMYFKTGDADPRFGGTAMGPTWGSGSGAVDTEIRRNSASEMLVSDTVGTAIDWKMKNALLVGGFGRFDEITSPGALTNKAIVFAKDNGAGKTQLIVRFGTGAEQIIATEP